MQQTALLAAALSVALLLPSPALSAPRLTGARPTRPRRGENAARPVVASARARKAEADCPREAWNEQTVRWSADTPGWETSLALDATDQPHLASATYGSATELPGLYYSYRAGADWAWQTVDLRETRNLSLARGASTFHVAYLLSEAPYPLLYASRSPGGTWSIQTVDSDAGYYAWAPSLAVSEAGTPHIVYRVLFAGIKYAVGNGASWTVQTLETVGGSSWYSYPRIALDGAGHPRIVFDQPTGDWWGAVRYAAYDGSQWSFHTLDAGGDPLFVLDSSSNPHLVYWNSEGCIYQRYEGGTWFKQRIHDCGWVHSIAVDTLGNLHLTYDEDHVYWNGLRWGRRDRGDGWFEDDSELRADSTGKLHVASTSYYDDHAVLRYLWKYIDPLYALAGAGDYDGDGTSDAAVFRPSDGSWAIRNLTRTFFGSDSDHPASGDYNGDGTADIAVFRPSAGLWSVRGLSRFYFGGTFDQAVPRDYNGNGTTAAAIFRPSAGMWATRGSERVYFGSSRDTVAPGDYDADGRTDVAIYRPSIGLWSVRNLTRFYFGSLLDRPCPGDYDGDGTWEGALFRPDEGQWMVRQGTRYWYGGDADLLVPADYDGDGIDDAGLFRDSEQSWMVRDLTRFYFGDYWDIPATR